MKRKQKIILESILAFILLAILLSYALPIFLRSQRAARFTYLFHEMEQIVNALKAYRMDYHQLPPRFYDTPPFPGYHIHLLLESATDENQWEFARYTIHEPQLNWENCFPALHPKYLSPLPQKLSYYEKNFSFQHMIYTYHLQTNDNNRHTFNWGIAVVWPFASRVNQSNFEKVLNQPAHFHWNPSITKRYYSINNNKKSSPLDPFIHHDYYYAPSNGMESSGFLYLDLAGNHSPQK